MTAKTVRCPSCNKPIASSAAPRPSWAPFCSERCKMADLGRWLRGDYAIPAEEPPDDVDEEIPGDADR